jgi:hypothetical protein
MLRGSKPGERRGGRERGTPNRRTILRDRTLCIGLEYPAASLRVFLRKLANDRKLPADTRIALAPRCFPPPAAANRDQAGAVVPAMRVWKRKALETLLGVVQDATADPKARRKAAQKIAEFLVPKVGRKPKVIADQYGFLISPNLAKDYRDTQLELSVLRPTRKIPAIAEEIGKLEARSDAILRRLQMPCPGKYRDKPYGDKQAANDIDIVVELRRNGTALTQVQQAQEAHLWTRYAVFRASPEQIARRRRQALEDADRRFRLSRSSREFSAAPALSRKERNELKLLQRLYPAEPKQTLSPLEDDCFETGRGHPFVHEWPAPDGNFYPRHSKLRPPDLLGYTAEDLANDRKRLDQLRKARSEREKLTPNEHAEEADLAARVAAYELNPEAAGEARLRELEERRAVGLELTASEEDEWRELRDRDPELAAAMELIDLQYFYHWRRELNRARQAGVNFDTMRNQADVGCLRLRDPTKFIREWQARTYLADRDEAATAAAREHEREQAEVGDRLVREWRADRDRNAGRRTGA